MRATDAPSSFLDTQSLPGAGQGAPPDRRPVGALVLGMLAGVGSLVVLTVAVWLSETSSNSAWSSWMALAGVVALTWASAKQVATWNRSRANPVTSGRVAWLLLGIGLLLMLFVAPALSAAGAAEWVVGEVGVIAIVVLLAAAIVVLTRVRGRHVRGREQETATTPPPGHGTDYSEHVLQKVTSEPGALRPSPDEEEILEAAISQKYAILFNRSGQVLLSLPTVVRQNDLVLPLPCERAVALARDVFTRRGARTTGSWIGPDRTTLRGWWQSGPRINGCPVVVSIWLAAEGPQQTRVSVRTASKVFLLNPHIPERTLGQVVSALTSPQPAGG